MRRPPGKGLEQSQGARGDARGASELLDSPSGVGVRRLNVGLDVVDVRALLVDEEGEVLEDVGDLLLS